MSDALDAASRARAIAHLDTCDECRALLATLAREVASAPGDVALDATLAAPTGLEATLASGAGAISPGRALETGVARFGRYTLRARLGAGAMGVVYRAEDPELGREVALKQLHHPNAALTERLVREARAMARVSHPNVVAVYDVGVVDGSTYIAMELVTGTSLREWQARARHPVDAIVEKYIGAGRGLAAAHAAGIVHRDFKPDNVLVGDDGRVRVGDFGLAAPRGAAERVVDADADALALTDAGQVVGTPAYMAPEQFVAGHVDARTDQFNFCVALYEALFGRRPFEGASFAELADNVCEGRVRPISTTSAVSGGLRAIVLRGLRAKPGDRFPTMEHLLAELGRDRARPWRRVARAATVVAVVLALGVGADAMVRDRVTREIRQSFAATGRQVDRAFDLLTSRFDANANQVYGLPVMRDVAGHRDQADFGLGDEATDAKDLERIHEQLRSADWKWIRRIGGARDSAATIAVADYKGRLLYTSADDARWKQDLLALPWVKSTLARGNPTGLVIVRGDDPALVATGMLGPAAPRLVVFFTRTLVLNGEPASQLFQVAPAERLIDAIRLDDETEISLVAPDGTSVGDVAPALVAAAPASQRDIAPHAAGATTYLLERIPLQGYDGEAVGSVVLAREESTVLSLFPHARLVFVLALVGTIALAIGTTARARQIATARV